LGYVRIAQHYGFALKKVFDDMGFHQVIFLEEDMEIAPDFFSYFESMLPMLHNDPDLFCVSAWNDNGYASLVEDPKAVFRTDFFPGLGWMMDRSLWAEIRDRFAVAYWDEFMRRPDVRKGRHCIRPEISRSFTFGSEGTSQGQFFKDHLSHIRLNDVAVDWGLEDLHFLSSKSAFEDWLSDKVQRAISVTLSEIDRVTEPGQTFRIAYDDAREYKSKIAKKFHLMPDEKEGIRRMSYRGVIPFAWNGNRIYLHTRTWPSGLD
jgi:alpha-1,3-mannosyl-glycoprotein beta-1,2-N-acetylglucosaminyltransferase